VADEKGVLMSAQSGSNRYRKLKAMTGSRLWTTITPEHEAFTVISSVRMSRRRIRHSILLIVALLLAASSSAVVADDTAETLLQRGLYFSDQAPRLKYR